MAFPNPNYKEKVKLGWGFWCWLGFRRGSDWLIGFSDGAASM